MKRTHLMAALVAVVAVGIFTTDASAYYNPSTGTFMSRDPGAGGAMAASRVGSAGPAVGGKFIPTDPTGQYRDGPNLYQYVRDNPITGLDPQGLNTRWYPSGSISDGKYGWSYSFDATYHPQKCRLGFRVKIQLNAKDSGVEGKLNELAPQWKQAVENAFNQWKLVPEDSSKCCECKDGIALHFRPTFVIGWTWTDDQEVKVDWTSDRSDMMNWHIGDSRFGSSSFGGVVHEVGHMYGLKDEYIDPDSPKRTIASEGAGAVMHTSGSGSVLKRHIEEIVNNIAKVNVHLPCPKYKVEPK